MIPLLDATSTGDDLGALASSMGDILGVDFFDDEIDNVIFMTNSFLTNDTFTGSGGPFWWILESCMALGALFSIITAGGMAFKMYVKGETFDVLKILKILAISIVMMCWYPGGSSGGSVIGVLSFVPNCIGSYTHDLYEAEALQVQEKFDALAPKVHDRDSLITKMQAEVRAAKETSADQNEKLAEQVGTTTVADQNVSVQKMDVLSTYSGFIVGLDKLLMTLSVLIYRIGWWGTMYCQQILLGMLTIFGPIQWAFSVLPKWEGAWAKWTIRYLTVHFYGAMLYFVGFYVLLLFDIVLSIQEENLNAIVASQGDFNAYVSDAFLTAGYLIVASAVALKCLNLVPDLAAWIIPEGDTAFSTRNFGEGISSEAKRGASSIAGKIF